MKHPVFLISVLLSTFHLSSFSQNNILGGFIHAEQNGDCASLTLRANVFIYSIPEPGEAKRDTIRLYWGDGTSVEVPGSNMNSVPVVGEIQFSEFSATHVYAGQGQYQIYTEACCLTSDLLNVSENENIPFKASVLLTLFNWPFQGCNSSVDFSSIPIDFGFPGQPFVFNPGAYETDGDSIAYHIIDPFPELDYRFPDEIEPGPNNNFFLDERTGTIRWEVPQTPGYYVAGIKAQSYRNQIPVDESLFLMQIRILDFDILLFPNPASKNLTITLVSGGTEDSFELRVYNMLGQLVLVRDGMLDLNRYTLDIGDFANGTYLLDFESSGKRWVRKFIKL
jgi:type IX secretion system substrate protein